MPVKAISSLPKLLYAFFHEWLTEQRNASHRTVLAYRDAWRLFLCFVAERQKIKVASLGLDHLNRAEVAAFLQHIEKTRRASIVTRNCRLAALRSFFGFVAAQEPLAALQCAEVLQVPFKKAPKRAIRISTPRKSQPFSANRITLAQRASAITPCSRCCITAARESRKRLISSPKIFT